MATRTGGSSPRAGHGRCRVARGGVAVTRGPAELEAWGTGRSRVALVARIRRRRGERRGGEGVPPGRRSCAGRSCPLPQRADQHAGRRSRRVLPPPTWIRRGVAAGGAGGWQRAAEQSRTRRRRREKWEGARPRRRSAQGTEQGREEKGAVGERKSGGPARRGGEEGCAPAARRRWGGGGAPACGRWGRRRGERS